MIRSVIATVLLPALLAGLVGGCESLPTGQWRTGPLEARPDPPVQGIPVPLGFELNETLSRSYESTEARFIDHVYDGRAAKQAVERFYAERMPDRGWDMQGTSMTRGEYLLRFSRANEICEVRISTVSPTFAPMKTRISVNLQTKGESKPESFTGGG